MSEIKPEINDQAKDLRALFDEVNNPKTEESVESISEDEKELMMDGYSRTEESVTNDVNVLNLPPRKVVHGGKKKRIHLRVSRPFLRFGLVVILLLALLAIMFLYGESVS